MRSNQLAMLGVLAAAMAAQPLQLRDLPSQRNVRPGKQRWEREIEVARAGGRKAALVSTGVPSRPKKKFPNRLQMAKRSRKINRSGK